MSPAKPAGTVSIRLLLVLIVATALGPMAMQIFIPALPAIQERFGVSPATAQLTLSLSAFAIALATLAYGPLSGKTASDAHLAGRLTATRMKAPGGWDGPAPMRTLVVRPVRRPTAFAGWR